MLKNPLIIFTLEIAGRILDHEMFASPIQVSDAPHVWSIFFIVGVKTSQLIDVIIFLNISHLYLSHLLLNPHTLEQITPSHARCAENCGSALTHR